MSDRELHGLDVGTTESRYLRWRAGRRGIAAWGLLVLAPTRSALTVLVSGLVVAATTIVVTVGVTQWGRANGPRQVALAGVLLVAMACQGLGRWFRQRTEMSLVMLVRQLIYRRFRSLAGGGRKAELADKALTYPGQISQFVYVIDLAVSGLEALAIVVVCVALFGVAGVVACALVTGFALGSIELIKRIGALWSAYMGLEGRRRAAIQRIARSLPRSALSASWAPAIRDVGATRSAQEALLRRRVRLQVANGFTTKAALGIAVAIAAMVALAVFPGSAFGIGILVATRYLHGTVSNALVDYRVIRLAVPMLIDLDDLEERHRAVASDDPHVDEPARPHLVALPLGSAEGRRALARAGSGTTGSALVSRDTLLDSETLTAWRSTASPETLQRLAAHCAGLGIGTDVLDRAWTSAGTLSSGELHRVCLALALVDEPGELTLEDTFSSLDPDMRDVVGDLLATLPTQTTLVYKSTQYVPRAFRDAAASSAGNSVSVQSPTVTAPETPALIDGGETVGAGVGSLPETPPMGRSSVLAVARQLLGWPGLGACVTGALLLAGSDAVIAIAASSSRSVANGQVVALAVGAVMALLGSTLFVAAQTLSPITRLSGLHGQILHRIQRFARPGNAGAVTGRLGEDFSELQMSVPGALAGAFLVVLQVAITIVASAIGSIWFAIMMVALVPVAVMIWRDGARRIMPASQLAAAERGRFLGLMAVVIDARASLLGISMRRALTNAFRDREVSYLLAGQSVVDAYGARSRNIEILIFGLNAAAIVAGALPTSTLGLAGSGILLVFAMTLSGAIQTAIEAVQSLGVVGLTVDRVLALTTYEDPPAPPPAPGPVVAQLVEVLARPNVRLVGLLGPTGAGKSVALDALAAMGTAPTTLEGRYDPLAPGDANLATTSSAQREALDRIIDTRTHGLVLLDETLSTFDDETERGVLARLSASLEAHGGKAVIATHNRHNLSAFDAVVEVGSHG